MPLLPKKLVVTALAAGVGLSFTALLVRADDKAAGTVADKADAKKAPVPGEVHGEIAKLVADVKADLDGFTPLFNGKDLTGWEGNTDLWSVQDGAITGKTTKDKPLKSNTFLILKDKEVSDFELRFQYKIVAGNSGVQYRAKRIESKDPTNKFAVGGYQADFEAGTKYSGINYNEQNVAGKRGILAERGTKVHYKADGTKETTKLEKTTEELQQAIKSEDWNEYVVVAKGPHMIHKINGNVTSEVIDEDPAAVKKGIVALQVHVGPPMTVQFKDVLIKETPAAAAAAK